MFDEEYQHQEKTSVPAFDWRNLLYILLEQSRLIILCLVLAAFVTAVYLARAPVIYATIAVLKYETEQPKILNIEGVVQDSYRGEDVLSSKLTEIEQLLKSPATLAQVVATNNLATNPRFDPEAGSLPISEARLMPKLAGMVHLNLRHGTHLIEVIVDHTDPQLCAQIANSMMYALIRQNAESYKTASQLATAFLADEAQQLQKRLNEAEAKLQTYKDQSLSLEQRQAIVAENLKSLNAKVEAARAERVRLETDYQRIRKSGDDLLKLLESPAVAADPTVVAARAAVTQAEIDFAATKQVFLPKHPAFIEVENKLEKLQQTLSNAIVNAAQVMRVSYENAVAQESALAKELEKQELAAQSLNRQFVPYNVLLRDIEQYRALYDSVVKRMGETTIAGNLDQRRIQVFQEAPVPKRPIKPNKPRVLALAMATGLGLGLALALGRGLLDDSIKSLTEAEQFLKLPVLSTIPQIRGLRNGQRKIVMEDDSPASGAESFRSLRTSLSMLDREKPHRSFLFTSSMPGEGKTFCAVNYAVSLAQQGFTTLLIDCDLRRPMAGDFLGFEEKNKWGVAQFLGGKQKFDVLVQGTAVSNLWFLSAGPYSPSAVELLTQANCSLLLEEALRRFDRVVLDSAPIFGVSDTLLMVNQVDAVCMVVRVGKTPRMVAIRAVEVLERAKAPLAGAVLNGSARSRRAAYGDPYYDYGYYPKKAEASAPKT